MSAIDRFSSRHDRAEDGGLSLAFGVLVGCAVGVGLWLAMIVLAYVVSLLA